MQPHTRSLIAASAFAVVTGRKVAGLFDHALGGDRRIAAECRDGRLQGIDGDRGAKFGGTLPEIFDAVDKAFISLEEDGQGVRGYDRGSATFYTARVADGLVQVYDHGADAWFAYDVQDPDAVSGYHRAAG
ncbi:MULTISPECIES: hypothetical protein [Novosphingobium]|jgi:hypothetical protein|uniref:Uncharacterized protein n=1 Tax=Novosphingobium panipatense TaxID=428991 RepID=A0ABY1Q242_9SPHN|nr:MULTISPECIES: hypothetical protein [Novosphingobium]SMP52266.1 hypothetical protein SAMN06296065_101260 [Novosphingobium panipatense]